MTTRTRARRILRCLFCGGLLASTMPALAALTETPIPYAVDQRQHLGYAIHDNASSALRPLLVMVPNWMGNSTANRRQAQDIAARGYVVFMVDMYGADALPTDSKEAAAAVSMLYANRAELRKRALEGYEQALHAVAARKLPVARGKVAAIGFCFGGATVLELARSGLALPGVVSFHGNLALDAPAPASDGAINTRILALHGDADPYVPPGQVAAFVDEMRRKQADWQLVSFGGAVHSFTDPDAAAPGKAMYDRRSAERAFTMMQGFLSEILDP